MNNSEIDDGGPAFPNTAKPMTGEVVEWGMPLRDWFAGMALQGVMATASGLGAMTKEERGEHLGDVAEILYDMADAMLAARKGAQP